MSSVTLIAYRDPPAFSDDADFVVRRNRRLLVGKGEAQDVMSIFEENLRLWRLLLEARADRDRLSKQMAALLCQPNNATPPNSNAYDHHNRSPNGHQAQTGHHGRRHPPGERAPDAYAHD
jgi:hypothetical protein